MVRLILFSDMKKHLCSITDIDTDRGTVPAVPLFLIVRYG